MLEKTKTEQIKTNKQNESGIINNFNKIFNIIIFFSFLLNF